jgi:hypothetical protein
MKGLEFEHDCGGAIVRELLKGIVLEQYDWYCIEDEIIKADDNFRLPERLTAQEVEACFWEPDYLAVFLNLQAYPKNTPPCGIDTYEDFLHSACEFVLLITDANLIEIYAKSRTIGMFTENVKRLVGDKYTVKTAEDDGRTRFRLN